MRLIIPAAVLGVLLGSATAWAAPADEVRSLLEQGKASEAYTLGRTHPDALGNPEFDFYFGIAAIDAGHAGEGVLALERYLLQFPENTSARLQLARGYFALGEDGRAREEFESVLKLEPPADVAATVQRFLDAIRVREARYLTTAGAYVELGIGRDTNVNSGVSGNNVFLPAIGPVVIARSGQKLASNVAVLGAGGFLSHPVAPGVALFATATGEQRFHEGDLNQEFEQGNFNVAGGVSVLRAKNLYRFGISYGALTVGSPTYRKTLGVSAEWQYQIDERQSFSLGAQLAQLDHPDPNAARDADFYGLSLGYRRLITHDWQPTLNLGLNAGRQHSRTGRPDLVPDSYGVTAGISLTPAAKWGVALGYQYQQSDYRAVDALLAALGFPDARKDRYHALNAVVSYLYSRNLSFRAEGAVVRNDSNIELFAFPRESLMFKVRYEFK